MLGAAAQDYLKNIYKMTQAGRHTSLSSLEPGQEAIVRRVADGDPEMLRYMGSLGLYPDTPVEMLGKEPYGGSLRVRVSGEERQVGRELAENVFVSPREA